MVLSKSNTQQDEALLKLIVTDATKNLESKSISDIINTINMILHYIIREQLLLFKKQKIDLENRNPSLSTSFMGDYKATKEQGCFLRI